MKLHNKKTGKIINGGFVVCEYKDGAIFSVKDKPCFDSLDELKEDWEDYKPAEPLIKDEKIRKAVRAWAEASGITKVLSYGDCFWIGFRSVKTESVWKFECSYSDAFEFELDKEYTITELCGEEEE